MSSRARAAARGAPQSFRITNPAVRFRRTMHRLFEWPHNFVRARSAQRSEQRAGLALVLTPGNAPTLAGRDGPGVQSRNEPLQAESALCQRDGREKDAPNAEDAE